MAINWGDVFGGKGGSSGGSGGSGGINWGKVFEGSREPEYFAKARKYKFDYNAMQKADTAELEQTQYKNLTDMVSKINPILSPQYKPGTLSQAYNTPVINQDLSTLKGLSGAGKGLARGAYDFGEALDAGVVQFGYGAARAGGQALRAVGEIRSENLKKQNPKNYLGSEENLNKDIEASQKLAESGKKFSEGVTKSLKESRFAPEKTGSEIGYNIGGGIASLATAFILTKFTKSSAPASILFGGMASADQYEKARDAGKSPDQALGVALPAGLTEAALEKIGLDKFVKVGGKILPNAVKRSLIEGFQESAQTFAQNLFEKSYNDKKNIYEGVVESGLYGAGIGGGSSVGIDLINKQANVTPPTVAAPSTNIPAPGAASPLVQAPDIAKTPSPMVNVGKDYNQPLDGQTNTTKVENLWESKYSEKAVKLDIATSNLTEQLKVAKAADKPALQIKLDALSKQSAKLENNFLTEATKLNQPVTPKKAAPIVAAPSKPTPVASKVKPKALQAGKTYYHGTTNAKSIRQSGFGSSAKDVKYGNAIYLSSSKSDAISFGQERSIMRGKPGTAEAVKIKFTKEPKIYQATKEPTAAQIKNLKSQKYDGVEFKSKETFDSDGFVAQPSRNETVIWNKDIVKSAPQAGKTKAIPKAVVKTPGKVAPIRQTTAATKALKPLEDLAMHLHNKPADKITPAQLRNIMASPEFKISTADGGGGVVAGKEYIQKFGNKNKAIAYGDREELSYGSLENGYFTDSYIAVLDKKMIDDIDNKVTDIQVKKQIKYYNKESRFDSMSLAEKTAQAKQDVMEVREGSGEKAPDLETLGNVANIKTKAGTAAKITGYYKNIAVLSDGKTDVTIDADKLALFDKYFPDATYRIGTAKNTKSPSLDPVQIISKNKIVGVIMPMREGDGIPANLRSKSAKDDLETPSFQKQARDEIGQYAAEPVIIDVIENPEIVEANNKLIKKGKITFAQSEDSALASGAITNLFNNKDDVHLLILNKEEYPVAGIQGQPGGFGEYGLTNLYVHPGLRNQGMASKLLKEFENRVQESGYTKIVLKSPVGDFYKKQGYVADANNKLRFSKVLKTSSSQKETVVSNGLTTSILEKLKGKEVLSRQEVSNLSRSGDVKLAEKEIIDKVLRDLPAGEKFSYKDFSNAVKTELLPLKVKSMADSSIAIIQETDYVAKSIRDATGLSPNEVLNRMAPYKGKPEKFSKEVTKDAIRWQELIDIQEVDSDFSMDETRHRDITLKPPFKGNVLAYNEKIYESNIKTKAGKLHFGGLTDNYFANVRDELMPNKLRRILEIQSDLFQKGRLKEEVGVTALPGEDMINRSKATNERIAIRENEINKLQKYKNDWYKRIIREEIKSNADNGMKTLQFPTGETAMKIEGLGEPSFWADSATGLPLTETPLRVGQKVYQGAAGQQVDNDMNAYSDWIITDVFRDGKFRAVPKNQVFPKDSEAALANSIRQRGIAEELPDGSIYPRGGVEHFDISGKMDTNSPIYKYYENDVQKFLKRIRPDLQTVTDKQGITWFETKITLQDSGDVVAFQKSDKTELLAIHNLTEENLQKAIELGGLPQSSVAIVNPKKSTLDNFGEITLVADKNLINPEATGTRTFASDVYSPRQPKGQLKADRKTEDAINKYFENAIKKYGNTPINFSGYNDVDQALHSNPGVMGKFLEEKGIKPNIGKPRVDSNTLDGQIYDAGYKAEYQIFLKDSIDKINTNAAGADLKISDLQSQFMKQKGLKPEPQLDYNDIKGNLNKQMLDNEIYFDFNKYIIDVARKQGATYKIFAGTTQTGAQRWLDENLDNILKTMRKDKLRAGEQGFGSTGSLGATRSKITPEFKNISDIIKSKNLLTTKEKMETVISNLENSMSSMANKLQKYYQFSNDNPYTNLDNQMSAIGDYLAGGRDKKWFFQQYKDVPDVLLKKLDSLRDELRNAPTEYFESVSDRAVKLNEFKKALVPEYTDQKIIKYLESQGTEVIVYKDFADKKILLNQLVEKENKTNAIDRVSFQKQRTSTKNAVRPGVSELQNAYNPSKDLAKIEKYLKKRFGKDAPRLFNVLDSILKREPTARAYYLKGMINLSDRIDNMTITHETGHFIELFATEQERQMIQDIYGKPGDVMEDQRERFAEASRDYQESIGRGYGQSRKDKARGIIQRIIDRIKAIFGKLSPERKFWNKLDKELNIREPKLPRERWITNVEAAPEFTWTPLFQKEKPTVKPKPEDQPTRQSAKPNKGGVGNLKISPDNVETVLEPIKPPSNLSSGDYNTDHIKIDDVSKEQLDIAVEDLRPQFENLLGKKLSNDEIIKLANNTNSILNKTVKRDETAAAIAANLKLRERIAMAASQGKLDSDFVKDVLMDKAAGANIARQLNARRIDAEPKEATLIDTMLDSIMKTGVESDKVIEASKKYDLSKFEDQVKLYREFVKPKVEDWLDLLRYNSMLSSPNTHVVNTASNWQGTGLIAPLQKAIEGGLDFTRATITRKDRTRFAGEFAPYLAGYYSNLNNGIRAFTKVMKGQAANGNLDMRIIPLTTKNQKVLSKVEGTLNVVSRLLEGMDQFFTTMTSSGVESALQYRQQKGVKVPLATIQAKNETKYRLFRNELMVKDEGTLLNAIGYLANQVNTLRKAENPLVRTTAKLTFPFLVTPTNISKQAVEFTLLGVGTLPKNKDKTAQLAKMIIGASVAAMAAMLLGANRMTWGEPKNEKQREAFRAAGLQPYSVKIGNNWVNYSRLHPALAFNLAILAAVYDSQKNGKLKEDAGTQILTALANVSQFYADATFLKNMSDIIDTTQGNISAPIKLASNYVTQFIPFRALAGWTNRFVDDVQRTVDPDANILQKQLQYVMMQIPFLSSKLPARTGPSGEPIKNTNVLINAFTPNKVTTEDPDFKQLFDVGKVTSEAQKGKTNKDISKAIKDGDNQKARDIADKYNAEVTDGVNKAKGPGDLTEASQKIFDDALIDLTDKSIKRRKKYQERKDAEARGEVYKSDTPNKKTGTTTSNATSKTTGSGRATGPGSRGGRVSSGRTKRLSRAKSVKIGKVGRIGSLRSTAFKRQKRIKFKPA